MDTEKQQNGTLSPADSVTPTAESATVDESIAPAENIATTPPTTEVRYRSSWLLKLAVFCCLLVALLGCAASGYLYWLQLQQQQANAEINQQLQQALQAPKDRFLTVEQQLQQSLQQQQSQSSSITQLTSDQQQLQQQVATLAQRHPNHWLAAEAEYLVRMAGRKLWLERDPQTAVSLLQAADERLDAMQEPSLTPLRKALAKDIADVAEIKSVDVAGTVFTLDGIISKLDKMPLHRMQASADGDTAEQPITASAADWKANLARTWKALTEDFFTVRRIHSDITPLLSPQQEWYLEENIRNKLLQAQLALYQYNELNYRQSITMANRWIQQYYDLEDEHTKEVISALDALAALKIDGINMQQFQSSSQLKQLVTYGKLLPQAAEAAQ